MVSNWWYDYNGFRAKVSCRQWTGEAFQVIWTTLSQSEFTDVRNISDLNFWPLSAAHKAKLEARGKVYAEQVRRDRNAFADTKVHWHRPRKL